MEEVYESGDEEDLVHLGFPVGYPGPLNPRQAQKTKSQFSNESGNGSDVLWKEVLRWLYLLPLTFFG